MASSFRGTSTRPEFEDVLKQVGRGSWPRRDEDAGEEETGENPALHASFDFLRALDNVSGLGSAQGGPSGGSAGSYVDNEPESDAVSGARPGIEPDDMQAEPPRASAAREAPEAGAIHSDWEMPEASDPTSLIAELGLRPQMTPDELKRLRRDFALRNHPDRLHPARRETASRRMKTVNALIDAALRRAR